MAYGFYESGLAINVMYDVDNPEKRAVGFKLSVGTSRSGSFRLTTGVRSTQDRRMPVVATTEVRTVSQERHA